MKHQEHQEHITKFYTLGRHEVDCELTCSCGDVVGAAGHTQEEAHELAKALWYEHLQMVRRNQAKSRQEPGSVEVAA